MLVCSAAGVVLGGSASWAESSQCMQDKVVTNQCLTENPVRKTGEGMMAGMLAGAGAAVGATWSQRKRKS
ncbi:MAG: LPXTG cell wall anchor domain-containing protein [Plectolyngbya sp. WJT66-NPBG17]|nr:LPXTG cell wall anchor domain-containing protein [Plectolyngbya sp. WJT66-NPBG17]